MVTDVPTLVKDFVAEVLILNPMHANFIRKSLQSLQHADSEDLNEYISFCISGSMSLEKLANCYNTIVTDTQAEQFFFMKNKTYRHSTFNDVASDVYLNDSYMEKYMYGLAVTSFLWPNHNAMHRFFLDGFPRDVDGTYLEVGPGHGYYFMKAAQTELFDHLLGVDISPTSIRMTQEILEYYGINKRYGDRVQLLEADFLTREIAVEDVSVIVMGEVLEHVEAPEMFLARLRDFCGPDTVVYLTTCVNAPAIDHIYLFDSPEHVEAMIETAGLKIENSIYVPYAGKTLEECATQRLGVNVAYFLSKAQ